MKSYKEFEDYLNNIKNKPKLLLHSCCAPCSTSVLELLTKYFKVDIFYYNPNIYPENEYLKRKKEQEKEGGSRCKKCISLRMKEACKYAKENNYDFFTTTLSVSPHKNSKMINEIGYSLETEYSMPYLYSDFKKKEGYKRSILLSKKYNLYRQNYCGCKYSSKNL